MSDRPSGGGFASREVVLAAIRGYDLAPDERQARLDSCPEPLARILHAEHRMLQHAAATWPRPMDEFSPMFTDEPAWTPELQRDIYSDRYRHAGVLDAFAGFLRAQGVDPLLTT